MGHPLSSQGELPTPAPAPVRTQLPLVVRTTEAQIRVALDVSSIEVANLAVDVVGSHLVIKVSDPEDVARATQAVPLPEDARDGFARVVLLSGQLEVIVVRHTPNWWEKLGRFLTRLWYRITGGDIPTESVVNER